MRRLLHLLFVTFCGLPCYAQTADVLIERSYLLETKAPAKKPKNPNATNVVTDTTWVFSDIIEKDWQGMKFDDSKWKPVSIVVGPDQNGEHYTLANQMGQATDAKWIWSPFGEVCYLRKTFEAPKEIRRAEIMFIADDVSEVYVNGSKIGYFMSTHLGWGHRGCAKLFDLAPYLLPGQRNVIAATATNNGSCKGFAADIRINDLPFIPAILRVTIPDPPVEVAAKVKDLFKQLDDPNFRKRENSTRALEELVEKHGQMLYGLLNELRISGSLEQEWRVGWAWGVLKKERNAALLQTGEDGRFYYPRGGMAYAKGLLTGGPNSNLSSYRHFIQLKMERDEDKKGFDAFFRDTWKAMKPEQKEEIVLTISFLDWADFGDLLDQDRDTGLNTLIASAYGRMTNLELTQDRLDWLNKAKTSKHDPLARAATAALLNRGVK
jgi:hypothetical protein